MTNSSRGKRDSTAVHGTQCFSFEDIQNKLKNIYKELNKPEFIHPDPLEFIYNYTQNKDREIVGLIGASLAYGRVAQILKSVSNVLRILTQTPANYLKKTTRRQLSHQLKGFKHRFTTEDELVNVLWNIRRIHNTYESLENCFLSYYSARDQTTQPALSGFAKELTSGMIKNSLIPSPDKGSACKRLHLYLRWMIRKDSVDPGCWTQIPQKKLIIPLDTHMYTISKKLGFTSRTSADLKTALEVTDRFRTFSKNDPVRYDFALTRLGIRNEMNLDYLLSPSSSKTIP